MKRLVLGVLLFAFGVCSAPVMAQPAVRVDRAGSLMDVSLDSLKNSVSRLMDENKVIASRSVGLREQLKVKKERLIPLRNEKIKLEEQMAAVQEKQQKKLESLRSVEGDLSKARQTLASLKADLEGWSDDNEQKARQERILTEQTEELRKEISLLSHSRDTLASEQEALAIEREDLKKEFKAATAALEMAKSQWQSVSAFKVVAGDGARFEQERSDLQSRIDQIRKEIGSLSSSSGELEDAKPVVKEDLTRLSQDVAAQEILVTRLRSEIKALESKGPSGVQGQKISDLKARNGQLKAELEQVRRDMVRLDKEKALLEKSLYQK